MKQRNKIGAYLGLLAGLVLLISACTPGAVPVEPSVTPAEHLVQLPAVGAGNDQVADQPGADEAVQPEVTPVGTAQPDEVEYPGPVRVPVVTTEPYPEPEMQIQPTPRVEMAASDPAGVSLASGKVQLVEFFAFW